MLLSYYFAVTVLSSYIAQVTAPNHLTQENSTTQGETVHHRTNSPREQGSRAKGKLSKCDVCNKQYRSPSILKIHMRMHTGERPFKCNICNKEFSHRHNLNDHNRAHTGAKPFKCNICGKEFNRRSTLNNHNLTHTDEEPFKCGVCGKRFKQRSTLNYHKRIHTGAKPFKCNICDKAFNRRSTLNNHKQIHTDEEPFKCDICDKKFKWRSSLKRHYQTHKKKQFKCGKEFSRNNDLLKYEKEHENLIERSYCMVTTPTDDTFSTFLLIDKIISYAGL